MAKRKPKQPKQETLEFMVEAKFEGNKCAAVRVIHPHLTWKRLGSMGIKMQKLADTLFQRENIQKDVDAIDKELCNLMFGVIP